MHGHGDEIDASTELPKRRVGVGGRASELRAEARLRDRRAGGVARNLPRDVNGRTGADRLGVAEALLDLEPVGRARAPGRALTSPF